MSQQENIVFVTVGSTKFDALTEWILSEEVVLALKSKGFEKMVIQMGNCFIPLREILKEEERGIFRGTYKGLSLETWAFKPSLNEEYQRATLVIGHAGSGTVIEVLRLGRKMIAVPNETLLHNHQAELAEALDSAGYLVSCRVRDLSTAIDKVMSRTFERFPDHDVSKFSKILDGEMGLTDVAL